VFAVGCGGAALLAFVVIGAWPDASQNPTAAQPTSTSTEFQENQPANWLTVPEEVIEPVIRTQTVTVVEQDTAEIDRLKKANAALNKKIADLGKQPSEILVQDEAALNDLRAQLSAAQQTSAAQLQAIEDLQRDQARLTAQLTEDELARLEAQAIRERQARMRAEAAAKRKAAEAVFKEQVNSSIVAFRRGGAGDDTDAQNGQRDSFVRAGLDSATATRAQVIGNPSHTVAQGTLIEAVLQTGINSDLKGNIIAITGHDVWSFDLDRVLIPRGSRLFGRYSSEIGVGQKRVLIAWDRIVTPDGQSVLISAYGADRLGRSGLSGKVNNHFFERFGTAALVSLIGAAPETLARQSDGKTTSSTAEAIGGDLSAVTGSLIAQQISRPPTITVEHGAIVNVIVNADLEML
jgi:type IV secretion system protein VirB10